ncbi:MAG TPA: hypothetical protein V6C84_02860 [Coleofasciculaceae cyanobacterium]|jgi:hypothetical protein
MLTDNLKLKLYPAIIGVMGVCLTALLMSRFEVQVFTEPAPPDRSTDRVSGAPDLLPTTLPTDPPSATASPTVPPQPEALPSASPAPSTSPQSQPASSQNLRVSNQTEYPVRVALLAQQPKTEAAEDANANSLYEQPVHWDFAPGEGKAKGLKLSLPDGTLQLQDGDVLMAFAQDGSRRYWGPYVVGKTTLPTWNAALQEWQLNLQP